MMIFNKKRIFLVLFFLYGAPLLCASGDDVQLFWNVLSDSSDEVVGTYHLSDFLALDLPFADDTTDPLPSGNQRAVVAQAPQVPQDRSTDVSLQEGDEMPQSSVEGGMQWIAKNVRSKDITEASFGCRVNLNPRAEKLMHHFKGLKEDETVCFKDLQDSLYKGVFKNVFEMNVLRLMHYGADIRERNGGYYYVGQVHRSPSPSEHVALAMYKLLCQKPLSSFEVRFQLYRNGYRDYTPEHLSDIEMALIAGGVHPYNRSVCWRESVDFCQIMEEIWEKTEDLSNAAFENYLRAPPREYRRILQTKHYGGVVRSLRELKKDNLLSEIQALQFLNARPTTGADALKQSRKGACKVNRRALVMQALRLRKNEDLKLEYLCEMAGVKQYERQGRSVIIAAILPLTLEERSIVYNRKNGTVKLLEEAVPVENPSAHTNLLTMLYDLMKNYGDTLVKEEVAYFADRGGYWSEGFKNGKQREFYSTIHLCRVALFVAGSIDLKCCPKKQRLATQRQKQIWELAKQAGSLPDLAVCRQHYSDATQDDLDTLQKVSMLMQSEAFLTFKKYIGDQSAQILPKIMRVAQSIEKDLREGPIPYYRFVDLCKAFGMNTSAELWKVAGVLTTKETGGRLLYNHLTGMFLWDSAGCVPHPPEDTLVSEVFSLDSASFSASEELFSHMLKQKGYGDVSVEDVQAIREGLGVLGLQPLEAQVRAQALRLVELLLKCGEDDASYSVVRNYSQKAWRCANKVVSWIHNGSFVKLWDAYQAVANGAPPSKRKRFENGACLPESVVYQHMQRFYKIAEYRVW